MGAPAMSVTELLFGKSAFPELSVDSEVNVAVWEVEIDASFALISA